MNRGGDRTSVRARHAAAERSRAALELRLRRVSYDDIARQLGYSNRAAAWKAIEREIAKVRREPAKELLALELETLDAIQRRMMPLVLDARPNAGGVDKGPDLWAVDRVIAVMDRRARMVGLDKIRDDSGVDEFRAVLVQWSRSLTAAVENDEREDEGAQ